MSHPAPAEQQDTANSALADRSDKTPCTSPRRHRGRRYPNRIPTMPQTAQTKPHAPVRAAIADATTPTASPPCRRQPRQNPMHQSAPPTWAAPTACPAIPQTAQTKPHAPVGAADVGRPAHPAPPPPST
jgi:hypothetical protein